MFTNFYIIKSFDFSILNPFSIIWDYPIFLWLIIAVLFLFMELTAPGFFFCLSFALGACVAAVAAALELSLIWQCIVSIGATLLSFLFFKICIKKSHLSKTVHESSATNIDALIGQDAEVTIELTIHKRGQVKIKGELWPAETLENKVLSKNSFVKIIHIKGNCLVVK